MMTSQCGCTMRCLSTPRKVKTYTSFLSSASFRPILSLSTRAMTRLEMRVHFFLLLLGLFVVDGYPSGSPFCQSFPVGHVLWKRPPSHTPLSTLPYRLTAIALNPRQILVTLRSDPHAEPFRGFFIAAKGREGPPSPFCPPLPLSLERPCPSSFF